MCNSLCSLSNYLAFESRCILFLVGLIAMQMSGAVIDCGSFATERPLLVIFVKRRIFHSSTELLSRREMTLAVESAVNPNKQTKLVYGIEQAGVVTR